MQRIYDLSADELEAFISSVRECHGESVANACQQLLKQQHSRKLTEFQVVMSAMDIVDRDLFEELSRLRSDPLGAL